MARGKRCQVYLHSCDLWKTNEELLFSMTVRLGFCFPEQAMVTHTVKCSTNGQFEVVISKLPSQDHKFRILATGYLKQD